MRTFVAIEIPAEMRRKIYSIGEKIPGRLSRVSEENIHITLQFLGELDEDGLASAESALNKISGQPFGVIIKGISFFGGRDVHTIYANVIDQGRIKVIYSDAGKLLSDAGLDFESEREYVPHATIARVKDGSAKIREFIGQNSDHLFGEFEIDSICLKRSVLSEKGPIYTTLYERKLG